MGSGAKGAGVGGGGVEWWRVKGGEGWMDGGMKGGGE